MRAKFTSCYLPHLDSIGVRQLQQNAASTVERVRLGESIEVTVRVRVAASGDRFRLSADFQLSFRPAAAVCRRHRRRDQVGARAPGAGGAILTHSRNAAL